MEQFREISVDDIRPDPDQPRRRFNEKDLEELASSIKEHGLMQPISVRRESGGFMIVAGERRWRASKIAGCSKIKVTVRTETKEKFKILAIIENVQREDLNPIEESDVYAELLKEYESVDGVAKVIGKKRSDISERLRLQGLSQPMREALIIGAITLPQALHLSKVTHDHQMTAFKKISQMNSKEWGRMVEAVAEIEQQITLFEDDEVSRTEKKEIMSKYDSLMDKVENLVRHSFKKDEISVLATVFDGESNLRAEKIDMIVKHLLIIRDALKRAKATQQSMFLIKGGKK